MSDAKCGRLDDCRSYFLNAREGLYSMDRSGRIIEANPALVRMLGYTSEPAMLEALNSGRNRLYAESGEAESLAGGLERHRVIEDFETRMVRSDGSLVWVSESARLQLNARLGQDVRQGFVIDVSARKGAETALLHSEKTFRSIIENAVEGIFQFVPNGGLLTANSSLAFSLGFGSVAELQAGCTDFVRQFFVDAERAEAFNTAIVRNDFVHGFEVKLRRRDGDRLWASINARAVRDDSGRLLVCEGSLMDVTDRKRSEDMLVQSLGRLNNLFFETVRALAKTVEIRDPYTAGHQENVADLACSVAARLGLDEDAVISVRLAGILHDIGKLYVPTRYLTKPARLDEAEMSFVREHSRTGYEILKNVSFPWPIAEFVLQHHERLDGSGYPDGLSGEAIRFESRIIAVADVVDAMASDRPYRAALGVDAAVGEIRKNAGRIYDRDVVEATLEVLRDRGSGADHAVRLS